METGFDTSTALTVLAVAAVLVTIVAIAKTLHARLLGIGIEQAAESIEKLLEMVADPAPHDVTIVAVDAHTDDARSYVEDITATATAMGFRTLGDMEDRTVSRAMPEARAVIRGLVSDDNIVVVGAFGRPAPTEQGHVRVLELSTELKDGRFLETVADAQLPTLDPGRGVLLERLAVDTAFADALATHRKRLADIGVAGVPVGDIEDAIQRFHRRVAVGAEGRVGIPAGITREELGRLSDSDPAIVDRVYAELVRRARGREQRTA